MMKMVRIALALVGASMMAACGSSHMMVLTPATQQVHVEQADLEYVDSTVGVPEEALAKTKQYMEDRFFSGDDAVFRRGDNGITVKYGFIGYKQGSRLGRYFLGALGNGGANMVLRAEFFDAAGNKLAEVQSEGEINAGFFGGSSNSAIKKAVKEIGDYAELTPVLVQRLLAARTRD